MKKTIVAALGLLAFGWVSTVSAGDPMDAMVGKWSWEGFVINVVKGGDHGLSAKVVSGPKNVGLEMIQSKLETKGDHMVGKIAHPMTGETYNSKLKLTDADTWHMDGCTTANVCASGDFKRMK